MQWAALLFLLKWMIDHAHVRRCHPPYSICPSNHRTPPLPSLTLQCHPSPALPYPKNMMSNQGIQSMRDIRHSDPTTEWTRKKLAVQLYVLALPFAFASHRTSVRIKEGGSCHSVQSISHPHPQPGPSSQRVMELDFQIDTSWCMGCSSQILPKRSYVPISQQQPPQPSPTRTS